MDSASEVVEAFLVRAFRAVGGGDTFATSEEVEVLRLLAGFLEVVVISSSPVSDAVEAFLPRPLLAEAVCLTSLWVSCFLRGRPRRVGVDGSVEGGWSAECLTLDGVSPVLRVLPRLAGVFGGSGSWLVVSEGVSFSRIFFLDLKNRTEILKVYETGTSFPTKLVTPLRHITWSSVEFHMAVT